MRIIKKIFKVFAWTIGVIVLSLLIFSVYVWKISDAKPPFISDTTALNLKRQQLDSVSYIIGDNWIRKNKYGLYEMYVSGTPFERGVINGKLSKELLVKQEVAFTDQIKTMIPSTFYLKFLRYVIGFMNRDLPEHVTTEDKDEIYGISKSASNQFDWIGTNYARQLNYHAAHDIGHALQNLMLVGCTSFGAWDSKTENGAMLIGRNFDFWVGDEFAVNKIVEFVRPTKGHNFAFVTWGGFIGVVSGMNDKGLTVTINAAKSSIPTDAATPVSLVAREILQYASNIKEAIAIAHKRTMFVSESFLIGSAIDHKSIIIEKTPDTLAIYDPHSNNIVCSNHYQSALLGKQELNLEQMRNSASVYRYKRTQQLMEENHPLTPQKMANILRDTKGMNGKNIGIGNEDALNQMIAHHSIIFMPDSLRFWVSTNPWQLGAYVCYDLKKVFAMKGLKKDSIIANESLNIAPDTFLKSTAFKNYMLFRTGRDKIRKGEEMQLNIPQFISENPEFYETYKVVGDYLLKKGANKQALYYYQVALGKQIPDLREQKAIKEAIRKIKSILK